MRFVIQYESKGKYCELYAEANLENLTVYLQSIALLQLD